MKVQEFVVEKLKYNGVKNVYPSTQFTTEDLFYYLLLFSEGWSIESHMADKLLHYATLVLEEKQEQKEKKITRGWGDLQRIKELYERINELKTGEINLGDFSSGAELANYLVKGV